MNEKTENPTREQLIERFAQIQNISIEDATQQIGANTEDEIIKNIQNFTTEAIKSKQPLHLNREQRRKLKKKMGAKNYAAFMAERQDEASVISETAEKLNYIDLIQKLRKLNKENEKNGTND